MKNIGIHSILLSLGLFASGWGADISPQQIIQNVEKNIDSGKVLSLTFEETYSWALTGEENVLSGKMLLGKGDQFRITTEDQIIVSDGNTLWTYSKPANRVLIDKVAESEGALLPRQIFFQYTQNFSSRLEGEVEIQDKKCYILRLEAEEENVFVPFVRVWVDMVTWLPVKIEQTDVNENKSVYLLHQIEITEKAPADSFRFEIPAGVEVIHMQ
jgi:outer membrane lipoprotein-sorting protein